ncbi:tudor domain-containing protein [Hansschlegelia beijingensis]|uniref:tudor domain-containing protein n=1 Tax=Hansschlegelia beijingensis TaxID=1133344 RepID=UPI0037FF03E2
MADLADAGRALARMISAGALLAAFAAISPAAAQSPADRSFTLANDQSKAIRDFRVVNRDGSWSGNWLKTAVPGFGSRGLRFKADRPWACVLDTRVVVDSDAMRGEAVFEQRVNFCGLTTIRVSENGVRTDRDGRSRSPERSFDRDPPRRGPDDGYRAPSRASEGPDFRVGDQVLGRWRGGEHWYPGVVDSISRSDVTIQYDDGDRETASFRQVRAYNWRPGQRVECNWKNGGTWYSGRIIAIEGDRLSINYDDGDRERTRTSKCRSR